MVKRHLAGLTYGRPGQTTALAVISAHEEQGGAADLRTWKRKVQRTWHLRKLESWASGVSVLKLAEDILRIRGELGLNDTFSMITVDQWGNSEVIRDLSKLTRGSGLEWLATPIVESEGSSIDAVRRSDLLYRWQSGVQQKILLVDPSFAPEYQEQALKLDHGVKWRSTDNDFLVCAIALSYWHTDEGATGYMPSRRRASLEPEYQEWGALALERGTVRTSPGSRAS